MLAKSIIAGTVLSLMAGGVVYFGTDIDTAAVKEKVADKTAEIKAEVSDKGVAGSEKKHTHREKMDTQDAETSVDMPSVKTASGNVIEAKNPTVSYTSEPERKTVKTVEVTSPEAPQKKWLDQYLKKDKAEDTAKTDVTETKEVTPEERTEENANVAIDGSSDSDTASYVIEDKVEPLTKEQIETAEAEGFEERALETENIWIEDGTSETGRKKATRKMLSEIIKKDNAVFVGEDAEGEKKVEVKVLANEEGETTIETETIDMGDGKIVKIVKKTVTSEIDDAEGKKIRIKVITDEDSDQDGAHRLFISKEESRDISSTVKVVMEQAEKIEMAELRDRAYLDLVSYGLEHGDYSVASTALTKIEQVELRDTARNRIAVAHAKDGNAEDAFAILDNIEVAALRDVMRLQVIEAMIAPDELPKDMQ